MSDQPITPADEPPDPEPAQAGERRRSGDRRQLIDLVRVERGHVERRDLSRDRREGTDPRPG